MAGRPVQRAPPARRGALSGDLLKNITSVFDPDTIAQRQSQIQTRFEEGSRTMALEAELARVKEERDRLREHTFELRNEIQDGRRELRFAQMLAQHTQGPAVPWPMEPRNPTLYDREWGPHGPESTDSYLDPAPGLDDFSGDETPGGTVRWRDGGGARNYRNFRTPPPRPTAMYRPRQQPGRLYDSSRSYYQPYPMPSTSSYTNRTPTPHRVHHHTPRPAHRAPSPLHDSLVIDNIGFEPAL